MDYLNKINLLYTLLCNLLEERSIIFDNDTENLYNIMEDLKSEIDYNFNIKMWGDYYV